MEARKRAVKIYKLEDLDIDPSELNGRELTQLETVSSERPCTYIEGESAREKGENLALALKEDKLI
jgi:hypothetical protein